MFFCIFAGFLVFLDNESAFGHSYRLISLYEAYHKMALQNVCVLRESIFHKLKYFSNISEQQWQDHMHANYDSELIPRLTVNHLKTTRGRITTVYKHFVSTCGVTRENKINSIFY